MIGDEELFDELRRMLSPPLREPPPESIAALHASVARQFRTKRRPWWQQKVAVGAAVFGLVTGAPAAAFAISGTPLPDPLRTGMHAIGLPVDSVRVADTKSAEADLESALKSRDEREISKAAAHLQTCLVELDRTDRARLAPRADTLLKAATSDTTDDGQAHSAIPEVQGSASEPSEHGGSAGSGGGDSNPSSGPSITIGSPDGDGRSSQTAGSSGGSGDGGQTTTVPRDAPPTTITTAPTTSGGGDGDTTATTTGESSGGGGGGGGSISSDGGSG